MTCRFVKKKDVAVFTIIKLYKYQSFVRIISTGSHSGFVQFVIRPVLAVLSVLLFVRLKSERYDIFVLK